MKERAKRSRDGKQPVECAVVLDKGERYFSHKVAPVHKFGQKVEASWARKFIIADRGIIQRSFRGRKTHARDSAHDS